GRVAAPEPLRRGDDGSERDYLHAGGADRSGGDDAMADTPREPLLAVPGDDRGEVVLGVGVDDFRRGQLLRAVHAHIERRVGPVREAALAPVELRAAHAQVEQDPHDVPLAFGAHDPGKVLEPTPYDPGT